MATAHIMYVVRIVDQYCGFLGMEWRLMGDFMRSVLSPKVDVKDALLDFKVVGDRMEGLVSHLEIAGFNKMAEYNTDNIASRNAVKMSVEFSGNARVEMTFMRYSATDLFGQYNSDAIYLSPSGLHVSIGNMSFDKLNKNDGTQLLHRMLDLKNMMMTCEMHYGHDNNSPLWRHHNSVLLESEEKLRADGYSIIGSSLVRKKIDDTCPVCYDDNNKTGIVLQCGHTVCPGCICKMLKRNMITCPLCRSDISFMGC